MMVPSLGSMQAPGGPARSVRRGQPGEAEKVRIAVDQLERAELYVAAAAALDLADAGHRRLIEHLLADLAAVRRSLSRLRVVD
jgi:hypothetical protein